jgi:uncharacterized membrane protein
MNNPFSILEVISRLTDLSPFIAFILLLAVSTLALFFITLAVFKIKLPYRAFAMFFFCFGIFIAIFTFASLHYTEKSLDKESRIKFQRIQKRAGPVMSLKTEIFRVKEKIRKDR